LPGESLWPPFEFPPECDPCPLRRRAKAFVPGFGNLRARLVVVLEKPGREEEREGKPTVGKTGEHLAKALSLGGVEALDGAIFRTNVRRCFVDNETPGEKTISIAHCARYLARELAACQDARAVLAVGADSASVLVGRWQTRDARKNLMGKLHGTVWRAAEVAALRAEGGDAAGADDGDEGEGEEAWVE